MINEKNVLSRLHLIYSQFSFKINRTEKDMKTIILFALFLLTLANKQRRPTTPSNDISFTGGVPQPWTGTTTTISTKTRSAHRPSSSSSNSSAISISLLLPFLTSFLLFLPSPI